ncbi:5-carboxymethyl-2-hydroxymuconate semialdehyde dehydrogenase [Vibrio maritimus]|uniref:5-carboxymethyl-2-hydroxymuconate semialdehyde dehydrogenase n=1 Tax=Vibrio maritimus TaxID=990268 RepID=A0A090RPN5_9VIBR|nr:5-carboxymethyl-2-hydroxymuconate semialdehyde dehydrogenase [Vibrio maritimus]
MAQQLDSNLTKAEQYLAKYRNQTLGHYIAGEWSLGSEGETFENLSPTNNESLGKVVKGSAEDVNQACLAAQSAFTEWAEMSGGERKKILHRLADKIEERAEEIALVESMDCGQPLRFMKQAAIRGAANFRFLRISHRKRKMDCLCTKTITQTIRFVHRLVLSASSLLGTRLSCYQRGR